LRDLDPETRIDAAENLGCNLRSRDDRSLFGDGASRSLIFLSDEILTCDIAVPDILTQSEVNELEIFGGKIHGQSAAGRSARGLPAGRETMREERPATSHKKRSGQGTRGETFECESVPPPESP
jgi:hypothetical protein